MFKIYKFQMSFPRRLPHCVVRQTNSLHIRVFLPLDINSCEVFVSIKQAVAGEIYLRGVDIFQDLTTEEITELKRKVSFREFAAGTVFYESLESSD